MKNTALTTSTMVLAGLLCAAPFAWADSRDHGRYNGYSQRHDGGGQQRYADSALGQALGQVIQREDRKKSERESRPTNRRDDRRTERRDNRRQDRRTERRTEQRDNRGSFGRDTRGDFGRDRRGDFDRNRNVDFNRVRSDDRRKDDRRRDDRRDSRSPTRIYQPLPPSQIYRTVPKQHQQIYRDRDRNAYRAPAGWVLDRRYRHDRYYPPRGHVFTRLPHDHRIVHYHGVPYYYWSGIWYRPSGVNFIVVSPPIGIVVPFLPLYYTTLWIGSVPYYYADGVYYMYSAADAGYVVVEAPGESTVNPPVQPQEELYIYPARGQSAQQQATDRYECHVWAVQQTNFDPTQPPTGISRQQFSDLRSEYLRAMKACLEGRGYTVK